MSSNNNNNKNRRVRSLRDTMDALEGINSFTSPSGKVPEMKIAHIPTLPDADACLRMLQRIRKEFYPIADRRGFSVLSVSEMCCCGDGLDHGVVVESGTTSKRRKRRKRNVMAKNVLGYNQTHFQGGEKKNHTIHLRLRQANNHAVLMSYEDVAGTMAHELAHCIHGPHNAKFYKLMDEIQEQHATFMVRGIVADDGGFPVNSRDAHVLGGGKNANNNTKATAAAAAEARKKKKERWMPQGPQKLGGDSSWKKWYTPGEAAAAAAEARRLEDEVWCQPCNDNDALVELLSSSDEEENDRKLPATTNNVIATGRMPTDEANRVTPTGSTCATIDLTGDSDDDDDNVVVRPAATRPATTPQSWPCKACTYRNEPHKLVCIMCNAESKSGLASNERLIEKLTRDDIAKSVRDDAIRRAKELEVARAKEEFGFNIYGNDDKLPTSTMKHIT